MNFTVSITDKELIRYCERLAEEHRLSTTIQKALKEYRDQESEIVGTPGEETTPTSVSLDDIRNMSYTGRKEIPTEDIIALLINLDVVKEMADLLYGLDTDYFKEVGRQALIRKYADKVGANAEQRNAWLEESKTW